MTNVWWEGFALPQLVAHGPAVDHNVVTFAAWCAERGVELAPHAKTTMSAPILTAQLAAGAWGLTVATSRQAGALLDLGVRRVLMANLLTEPRVITDLAERFAARGAEFWGYVDSLESVLILAEALPEHVSWPVLLEVGTPGGRTGVRTTAEAEAVAVAVRDSPRLRLAGTACFEGVIGAAADGSAPPAVREFLDRQVQIARSLSYEVEGPVISAGGSSFVDVVVDTIAGLDGLTPVVRSGCYVTHDHGLYARTSPLGDRATAGPRLEPALELLASVWSCPEPGVVIAGFGRRDVPFDNGLPVVRDVLTAPQDTAAWTVTKLWDQHAYVEVPAGATVRPGDVLSLGISHPCGAFDRWRSIPVLDGDRRVVDVLHPAL